MTNWEAKLFSNSPATDQIGQYDAKLQIAKQLAGRAQRGDVIGAGSGSTALLALQELAKRDNDEKLNLTFVPTSYEIEWACYQNNLKTASVFEHKPDWCFDGADEVDPDKNLIKGRGGAMYREKLVMTASETRYILVDGSKFVKKLGENFPVPVECDPQAVNLVEAQLTKTGASDIVIRPAKGKDGPVITEKGNVILDCQFSNIDMNTEKNISSIPGVLESGLFCGFDPEILST